MQSFSHITTRRCPSCDARATDDSIRYWGPVGSAEQRIFACGAKMYWEATPTYEDGPALATPCPRSPAYRKQWRDDLMQHIEWVISEAEHDDNADFEYAFRLRDVLEKFE